MHQHLWARVITGGAVIVGVIATSGVAMADGLRFSDFTPLPSSAGPTADEAAPITFGNPAFQQRSIAVQCTSSSPRASPTAVSGT